MPYRELAERAGVSLGSVSGVLQDLAEMDFIFEAQKRRAWKNRAGLLDRWVTAYHDILRPRLLQKRLRFSQPEQFYNWDDLSLPRADDVLLWGGEPGAALLTNQLTPEKFTLYTKGSWHEVMRALQLIPMDDGPIEVLDLFWTEERGQYQGNLIVPPLLIYADLMGSRMGRNIEIANTIRENELSYLFNDVQ